LLGFDDINLSDGKSVIETITCKEQEELTKQQEETSEGLEEGNNLEEEGENKEQGKNKSGKQLSLDLPPVSIKEFDLLNKSAFRWIFDGQQWRLPVAPAVYTILIPQGEGKFQALLMKKNEKPTLMHPTPLDLGYGQGICEDFARRNGKSFSRKDSPWRQQPATDKQVDLLRRLGINPQGVTKGEAADLIDQFFAKQDARKHKNQWQCVTVP
jgi:hypothetical protein